MKITKSSLLSVLLILTACFNSFFTVKADDFNQADSAYSSGDYSKAIDLYNKIAKENGVNSSLYFNLGNSYARAGDYGNAMVSYLRSLRMDPSNTQAKENIAYIDSKVLESNQSELRGKKYSLEADSPSFFSSIKLYIVKEHLSDTWAVWAIVCFILFMLCLGSYIFSKNVILRKIGFFGGLICFGFSVISILFSLMAASYSSDEGVITTAKIKLKSEASLSSKESPVNLTRGTRLTILDTYPAESQNPKWYKVRLNSDFIGWIQDTDFMPVGL